MPQLSNCRCFFIRAFTLFFLARLVAASTFNVTVDDSHPDPLTGSRIVYAPQESWLVGGQDCTNCTAHPNSSQACQNTWHESVFYPLWDGNVTANTVPTATFQFQGSALYVYCILAHTDSNPDSYTDMSFYIDGQWMGGLSRLPTGSSSYDYNVLVYANNSIPYGLHTFMLQNGRIGGTQSLVLLDYFVYTQEDNTAPDPSAPSVSQMPIESASGASISALAANSTPLTLSRSAFSDGPTGGSQAARNISHTLSSKARLAVIIAAALGSVGLLAAAVLIGLCWRRRRYRAYNLPPEIFNIPTTDLTEDPSASGWVEGTWPEPEEPIHPSLVAIQALKGGAIPRKKRGRALLGSIETTTTSSNSAWSHPSVDFSDKTHSRTDSRLGKSPIVSRVIASPGGSGGNTTPVTSPGASANTGRIKSPGGASGHGGDFSSGITSPLYSASTSALPITSKISDPSTSASPRDSKTVVNATLAPPGVPPASQLSRSVSADAVTVRFTPNRHPDMITRGGGSALASVPARVPRPVGIYAPRKPLRVGIDDYDDRPPAYEPR